MNIIYWVRKIPIVGNIAWIANAYAYRGDARSSNELAPYYLWIKAFFWNIFISILITSLTVYDFTLSVVKHFSCGSEILKSLPNSELSPGITIVSVFPNLLGLGIGIYALLYALDTSVVGEMHKRLQEARRAGRRHHGSVLMINSDMAFPLCALLLIIAVGLFAQLLPKFVWLQVGAWVAFWYGIFLILELIVLLFVLIDNSLLGKIGDLPPAGSSRDAERAASINMQPPGDAPSPGSVEVPAGPNERS
jgi:hypothetical protein